LRNEHPAGRGRGKGERRMRARMYVAARVLEPGSAEARACWSSVRRKTGLDRRQRGGRDAHRDGGQDSQECRGESRCGQKLKRSVPLPAPPLAFKLSSSTPLPYYSQSSDLFPAIYSQFAIVAEVSYSCPRFKARYKNTTWRSI
jgi:hypothetical protein